MQKKGSFRDHLLSLIVYGIAGLLVLLFSIYGTFSPGQASLELGTYTQLLKNRITHFAKERIFVVADGRGIYTLSDICTHKNCTLAASDSLFTCRCHNGVFDIRGKPLSGPVVRGLDHYYIYKNKDNKIVVDLTRIVDEGFRLTEK